MKPLVYMNPRLRSRRRTSAPRGFALVVTLSLMILLTVIAVGLLTLSSISLRSATSGSARAKAVANAKLGMLMALGQLQLDLGDDRRISADASISDKAQQLNLVGAWQSWSPDLARRPDGSAPKYDTPKTDNFLSWLVSAPDPQATKQREWPESAPAADAVRLFSLDRDGFDIAARRVALPTGSYAWGVSQENTKAKINVAGPDADTQPVNANLQAQPRPSLALSDTFAQPDGSWNLRAARLLSSNQVSLDTSLGATSEKSLAAGASYTVQSQGLLTDAVFGGLKVDMNLGFELSDSQFANDKLGKSPNPFRESGAAAKSTFAGPSSYQGQHPLFKPILTNPIVSATTSYEAATLDQRFYAAGVPTFDHLRSFYRIPHHLYGGGNPTVMDRGGDSIAISVPAATSGMLAPSDPPLGRNSQLSVRPVLDRVVYILSLRLGARDKQVRIVFTPIVTLWNPYNVALEMDGAVVFPWMDEPFNMQWNFSQKNASGAMVSTFSGSCGMAGLMGRQFETAHHGRSINPYFLCKMTADGTASMNKPIRFEPGEVRVFTPVSDVPIEFNRKGSDAERSVFMWPVDSIDRLHAKGGIAVPVKGGVDGGGFDHVMNPAESVQADFFEAATDARYHYFVTLEDSARIANAADNVRGKAITTVQMLQFRSETNRLKSPVSTYYELLNGTAPPFGVIETYHRVANQSTIGQNVADLVYTTNPRQIDINHLLSAGSFTVAPHYQSTLRAVSSIDGAIQTSTDGRNAFWGATNASDGSKFLPFFEIPRQPMLSLAGFQSADLASSTFSPSNQFANSWASPYLGANRAGQRYFNLIATGLSLYDTSYLANEALWDSYFFSGAAPRLLPSSSSRVSNPWGNDIARATTPLDKVVRDFVADPYANPLGNSRMRLYRGGLDEKALADLLLAPDGCARIAAHLMVDGAFNINSTDENAWAAVLAGLRGAEFDVTGGKAPGAAETAFPRFRNPTGTANDIWDGFRALNDSQIRALAKNLVAEVKKRGPFLSLGEFVNRRIENTALGYRGAIQAAIDATDINASAKLQKFDPKFYPREAVRQIDAFTGVGTPGFLTQADVLQSLAPVITPRSDTFTIRSYGEAKSKTGQVIATAMCEAVVQRVPAFVDPSAAADSAVADLNAVNQKFGRRFDVVSYRIVPSTELD